VSLGICCLASLTPSVPHPNGRPCSYPMSEITRLTTSYTHEHMHVKMHPHTPPPWADTAHTGLKSSPSTSQETHMCLPALCAASLWT
jgi:hypothetical protein